MIKVALASLFASAPFCLAATSAIGLAMANGSFQVDHSRVSGNATLFAGTTIETTEASSELELNNGVHLRLAANSRAVVFADRMVLEKGSGRLAFSDHYQLEAGSLRITGSNRRGVATVRVGGPHSILIAQSGGPIAVSSADGVLVARMENGRELSFDPDSGASPVTIVSGCLLLANGKFSITDDTTNVSMEVRGTALDKDVGNSVQMRGILESGVLTVTSLKRVALGGCTATAHAGPSSGPAATVSGAAAGGASTIAVTTAVIATVAIAATVVGFDAAGTLSSNTSPVTPFSR